jgi:NitT/TauT family transport system permease protein
MTAQPLAEAHAEFSANAMSATPARSIDFHLLGLRVVVLAMFLLIWWSLGHFNIVRPFFISSPQDVAKFLVEYIGSGTAFTSGRTTLLEMLVGLVLGSFFGILAGLAFARFPLFHKVFEPFLTAVNSLPRVALAPLFILWFGIGPDSKIYLSVSLVFFIVLVSTQAGIASVEQDFVTTTRALAASKRQIYLKVILPAAVPSIFAGLRLGAIYSLMGVVVGEMIGAKQGWGVDITLYSGLFQTDGVFGVLLLLALVSIGISQLMSIAERYLLRWQE